MGEYVGPFTVIAVIFRSSEVIRPEGAPNSLRRPDTTGRGVWWRASLMQLLSFFESCRTILMHKFWAGTQVRLIDSNHSFFVGRKVNREFDFNVAVCCGRKIPSTS
jgi:hypothetical protein